MEALKHLDLRAEASPKVVGAEVVSACRSARLVVVRTDAERGRHREFWDEALAANAERAAVDEDARTGHATGGLWSDVSFDPDRQYTFRHSKSAQPLHTDGSYLVEPPPVVFMVCHQAAPQGGATLFVDGAKLLGTLSSEQPELLRRLETVPVTFSKGGSAIEAPIVSRGEGLALRWNYYALSQNASAAVRQLGAGFRDYLQDPMRFDPVAVRLEPGEAVFFHDSEVLHGRSSFTAQHSGERCLWKGALWL
jgi:alpha-ketoglutarate-dependent taurine dioxygenase